MLFFEDAPLIDKIDGGTEFAADFSKLGPKDKRGRSLRDFDLSKRLFKYPCSFLIYSEPFQQLPKEAKAQIYHRLFEILSGKDTSKEFAHLSAEDRKAIREILRDTISDLPGVWK